MNDTTILGAEEQDRISHFLKRRQLNYQIIELLKEIKDQQDLKRGEITTAQNATYDAIIESLSKALKEGWITTSRVTNILDAAEVAGRQHVLLFNVPEDIFEDVQEALQKPETLNTQGVQLEEFWEVPLGAYTRLLRNDDEFLVVKVIARRFYWVSNETKPNEDRIEIVKQRERERSAVIIKLNKTTKLLQFRVPVREKSPNADTGRSVYEFLSEIVSSQFGDTGLDLFNKLHAFPIEDTYQNIIDNREDFQLLTDTPENKYFKSSMAHKGITDLASDLRDFAQWGFAEGFARTSVRGVWQIGDETTIDMRMHAEKIRTGSQVSRKVARVFFPKPCSDQEVEHVFNRIQEHLQ